MKNATLSNHDIYREKLLKAFPTDLPSDDLFTPLLPSYGFPEDEDHFMKQRATFYGKKWSAVDFDDAHAFEWDWGPFPALSKAGEIYYLPAFLNYFYEVKNLDKGNLCDYFDNIFFGILGEKEASDIFTVAQAKLIALFLLNLANLLDDTHGAETAYQKELTSHWGHFLLF